MAKIQWVSIPTVSDDARKANALAIEKLGLPKHRGAGRLAVVGGGPSIRDHLDELKAWDGTVWAVNGAINWCLENGIPAWFYTADASPMANWTYDLTRVRRAVLVPDCSMELIDHLQGHGSEITLTANLESGPTSVNASDFLSVDCGYGPITYFGCEGSFAQAEKDADTHAFNSFPIEDWIIVEVGGSYYKTKAEFVSQSIMLANILREFPGVYSEKSGGLLRAMVEHGSEYDVVMVSNALFAKLKDAA